MRRRRLPAALLFLLFAAACAPSPPPPPPDDARVVAKLGPVSVPLSALLLMAEERGGVGELPRDADGFAEVRRRLLHERLVDEVLLIEARARGVTVPDATLSAAIDSLLGAPPDPQLLAVVVARHRTESAWRNALRRRLRARAVGALLRAELLDGIVVADAQIAEAAPRFAPALEVAEQVRVLQIFDPEPVTVRALHARLLAGEDFVQVAASAGQDPELGWLQADAAPPLILDAVRPLSPGQHTAVLRSPLGYHVFLLLGRRPAASPSPAEVRVAVAARLREEVVERRLDAWLAEKMGALGLTVHEDVLDALRCCRDGAPYVAPKKDP